MILGGVVHRGEHDVAQMVVDEAVVDLASGPLACDDACGLEDAQVLADQWLRHLERVDEFVDAPRGLPQLQDDRDADGRCQRSQQFARRVEDLARRQVERRGPVVAVVLVAAVLLAALRVICQTGNGFH